MKVIISTVFIVLLVSIAQAGIFTTSPVSSTVWKAETQQTITWINAKTPPLAQLKNVKIQLMTGPEEKQIPVMTIGEGIQGTALKFVFKGGVPKNTGPSGQFYFLKYSDGDYSGFSARFTIDGIDGTIPGFDPNNPNATANNTTAGNSTSTDPNSGSYGNGNSTTGGSGGSTGGSGGSTGGSSGGSTTTNNSTKPTSTNKPSSTDKSSANSLGAVHVATFVIALVGMIISNWM